MQLYRSLCCDKYNLSPIDADEYEDSASSGDEINMCPPGEHNWGHDVCMICKFCGYCTGYGPGCCNQGLAGRNLGKLVLRGSYELFSQT